MASLIEHNGVNWPYIDNTLASAEKMLNKFEWVPVPAIGMCAGTVREWVGYAEIITGLAAATMLHIAANFTKNDSLKKNLYAKADICLGYMINGFGNVLRGNYVKASSWNFITFIFRKIALYNYDTAFRFNYRLEIPEGARALLRNFS